jgi:hypothetical protein
MTRVRFLRGGRLVAGGIGECWSMLVLVDFFVNARYALLLTTTVACEFHMECFVTYIEYWANRP